MPTKRANPAVPKARKKQSWAVQLWQERCLVPELALQHLGACDGGDQLSRKDKVPLRTSLGLNSLQARHTVAASLAPSLFIA